MLGLHGRDMEAGALTMAIDMAMGSPAGTGQSFSRTLLLLLQCMALSARCLPWYLGGSTDTKTSHINANQRSSFVLFTKVEVTMLLRVSGLIRLMQITSVHLGFSLGVVVPCSRVQHFGIHKYTNANIRASKRMQHH